MGWPLSKKKYSTAQYISNQLLLLPPTSNVSCIVFAHDHLGIKNICGIELSQSPTLN